MNKIRLGLLGLFGLLLLLAPACAQEQVQAQDREQRPPVLMGWRKIAALGDVNDPKNCEKKLEAISPLIDRLLPIVKEKGTGHLSFLQSLEALRLRREGGGVDVEALDRLLDRLENDKTKLNE